MDAVICSKNFSPMVGAIVTVLCFFWTQRVKYVGGEEKPAPCPSLSDFPMLFCILYMKHPFQSHWMRTTSRCARRKTSHGRRDVNINYLIVYIVR
mmetsp:Transcript_5672/g.16867  ORF Transcript_5672/g.16867 Transcript_5672/m.16867 type:complete len:95 (+) Transcript_5672:569-853(+)